MSSHSGKLKFSLKGHGSWQGSWCCSIEHSQVWQKFHKFGKRPSLNMFTCVRILLQHPLLAAGNHFFFFFFFKKWCYHADMAPWMRKLLSSHCTCSNLSQTSHISFSPSLNTLTCQYSVTVIVPPSGNRKLYFSMLLAVASVASLMYMHEMSCTYVLHQHLQITFLVPIPQPNKESGFFQNFSAHFWWFALFCFDKVLLQL